jgi:hypothetical protein
MDKKNELGLQLTKLLNEKYLKGAIRTGAVILNVPNYS